MASLALVIYLYLYEFNQSHWHGETHVGLLQHSPKYLAENSIWNLFENWVLPYFSLVLLPFHRSWTEDWQVSQSLLVISWVSSKISCTSISCQTSEDHFITFMGSYDIRFMSRCPAFMRSRGSCHVSCHAHVEWTIYLFLCFTFFQKLWAMAKCASPIRTRSKGPPGWCSREPVCHFFIGPSAFPFFWHEGLIRSCLHGSCGPMKNLRSAIISCIN